MAKEKMSTSDILKVCTFVVPWFVIYIITQKMILSFFAGLGCCILFWIFAYFITLPAKRKQENEEQNRQQHLSFYERCKANGVSSFESEKDRQRAATIAKNIGIVNLKNYKEFYEAGEKLYLAEKAAKEKKATDQRLAKLRKEEKEESIELSRYAYSKDNDKTISILRKKADQLAGAKHFAETFSDRAPSLLMEKEKNWAVAGGIASGIAGTAAGVATALDVQAKNAEIRARNQQKQEMISDIQTHIQMNNSVNKLSGSLYSVETEIKIAEEKLVTQLPEDKILNYMDISDTKISISETGAFRVSANIKMSKKLIIFDDVDAHIDGTLVCILSQNGKPVGEAPLVLPFDGIYSSDKQKVNLKGICLSGAKADMPYTVSYSGKHLYAIEN